MPRREANYLSDMEFDEVSLVDRPANQHARIVLAKRAHEEVTVPEYFNAEGESVDIDDLEVGAIVYDADGQAFQLEIEDDDDESTVTRSQERETVGKSLAEQVREDLSKAFTDVERNNVISKALEEVSKAEQRAAAAEALAKSERDLRLTREYIAKADSYGVPGVTADELGPVMMRAAELLPEADCVVLHKAFSSMGEAFAEVGTSGAATHVDPFGVIEAITAPDSELSKAVAAKGTDRHELIEKAFEADPAAYDRYLAEHPRPRA